MNIQVVALDAYRPAQGTVVVVDVLRAFTTAAVAFTRGAREIWPVSTVEEAFDLRDRNPGVLVVGEVEGLPAPGFDLPNSPAAVAAADLEGRTLVHRTSAGTQGIVRAAAADVLLAASFACAAATARFVAAHDPPAVTLVATGDDTHRDGDEDHACAEYVAALLRGGNPDPQPFLDRVPASTAGRAFADPGSPEYPTEDLAYAQDLDRFDHALLVTRRGDRLVMAPA